MSEIACSEYGIDRRLYNRVCGKGQQRANSAGFARMYISGLHRLVSVQDTKLENYKERLNMYREQLKMKDDMIELLKNQNMPPPSAPQHVQPVDTGEA